VSVKDYEQIVILDVETTGLGPDAGVVEIALIVVDDALNVLRSSSSLVNPGIPMDPGASAVSGITDDMLVDAPTLATYIREIEGDPFREGSTLVISHNAPFDYRYLRPYCADSETLCTLRLVRYLYPDLPNWRLATACHELGIEGVQDHRALGDTEMCLGLTRHLVAEVGSLDKLLELAPVALVEMTMPFGRYQGLPIRDLPADYVGWMRRDIPDLDGDLLECLNLHH
jgi:exodeoxyribonuclease X